NDDLQPVFKNLLGSLKYDDQNIQDSENKIQNFIFNTKTWRNLSPEDNNAGLKSFSNRYKNAVEDYNKTLPFYEMNPNAPVHKDFKDNIFKSLPKDVNRMNFKIGGIKHNLDNLLAELKKLLPNPLDLQYVTRTLHQGFFANNFAIITNGEINDKPLTDAEKQCGVTAISGQKNLGVMDMMTQLCMPSGQIKPSFDLTFNADHTISVTAKNYNNLSTQDLKRLPFGQIENTYEFKINLSQGAPGAKPSITDFKLSQKIMPSF
ncbi:MAG: hypothetical protein K6F05_07530, partial [Succinivibrio sp.]|nr:hypothetical protein [Succinivibrio sp.]